MKPFAYVEPRSVEEAVVALGTGPGPNRLLAGGTDLLVRLKRAQQGVGRVINLKRIAALRGIVEEDATTSIGALATLDEIARAGLIQARHPLLVETVLLMASTQVRNLATVGGNLANGSPAADLAPPLLCLDAELRVAGPGGERSIPIRDFFRAPGKTALAPDEILVRIVVPVRAGRGAFLKFSPRNAMDLAVVSVACFASDGVRRVALGAVAPTPFLVPDSPEEAARLARPIDDVRASAEYRRALVPVLVRRALERVGA